MPLATHSVIAGVDELEMNWKLKFSDSASVPPKFTSPHFTAKRSNLIL